MNQKNNKKSSNPSDVSGVKSSTVIAFVLLFAIIICIWLFTPFLIHIAFKHNIFPKPEASIGFFGDQFGSVNSLFSALAFVALVAAIILQMHELRIQRRDLTLSIDEMRKAADAQTAQVRIQSQTALLQILPDLIHEEAARLMRSSMWLKCHYPNPAEMTLEDLRHAIDTLRGLVLEKEDAKNKTSAELTSLQQEMSRQPELRKIYKDSDAQMDVAASWGRQGELYRAIPAKELELSTCDQDFVAAKASLESLNSLVKLKADLRTAYQNLKAYREWALKHE